MCVIEVTKWLSVSMHSCIEFVLLEAVVMQSICSIKTCHDTIICGLLKGAYSFTVCAYDHAMLIPSVTHFLATICKHLHEMHVILCMVRQMYISIIFELCSTIIKSLSSIL